MELEELEESTICYDCGVRFWPETDRGFVIGEETALCWSCALRRGGRYDASEERWTETPDLQGLVDPRQPHA
jgi:hypothetical protein